MDREGRRCREIAGRTRGFCPVNGRFPYTGTTGGPARIIASANGCTDRTRKTRVIAWRSFLPVTVHALELRGWHGRVPVPPPMFSCRSQVVSARPWWR